MKKVSIFSSLLLFIALASVSKAQTVSTTNTWAIGISTTWNVLGTNITYSFPKFNSALGELASVTFVYKVVGSGNGTATFGTNAPGPFATIYSGGQANSITTPLGSIYNMGDSHLESHGYDHNLTPPSAWSGSVYGGEFGDSQFYDSDLGDVVGSGYFEIQAEFDVWAMCTYDGTQGDYDLSQWYRTFELQISVIFEYTPY